MKLGILETGQPPESARERFGDYPSMFRALLGEDAYAYETFDVSAGVLPGEVEACEAYIVTGSAAGVYDPLPWIEPLKDFLVAARGRAALVGVCFGHQVMAEAFGGKAVKSPKGWGVGLHTYDVRRAEGWMDGGVAPIAVPASHQDQVVELPPGARVIAASAFTPMGMLAYDDQPAISIQLHPEFQPAYAEALIEARRGTRYTDGQADVAIASYAAPDDRARVGQWIKAFLEGRR
ncbi:type 1 glutamine amidotransferase [Phenylobacterium sp.]|uniref:glutamine amidotransferase-related protein n=1 Tax=Phenylobacterium sp. TaxID=1871053 RepID=UPI0035B45016